MEELRRQETTSTFVPDFRADSLSQVDFKLLKARGVKYIAFDADNTLVSFWGRKLDPATKKHIMDNRKLFKGWCIASNRITHDLIPLAKSIDASLVQANLATRKPHRHFFEKVIKQLGGKPEEIAMIGDKLVADVHGAKRMGMVTVWLKKLGHDSPWDWALRTRWFEGQIFRRSNKS